MSPITAHATACLKPCSSHQQINHRRSTSLFPCDMTDGFPLCDVTHRWFPTQRANNAESVPESWLYLGFQGGFQAVIWTDVFQSALMFTGMGAVLIKVKKSCPDSPFSPLPLSPFSDFHNCELFSNITWKWIFSLPNLSQHMFFANIFLCEISTHSLKTDTNIFMENFIQGFWT